MKTKCKKLMSAAVVSAIIAAQTLMPVAAAGGEIDADVSTMSPVLRVQVPTKMAVAVNEFEAGDAGSQVSSDEFTMKNLSEVAVKVEVTSTAEVGAAIDLVSTKAAAKESTATDKPAMWLAAAAAVKDNAGTLEYLASGTDKTAGALTGEEDNTTAFGKKDASNKSKAVQSFYLNAANGAVYKGVTGKTAKADIEDASKNIGKGADYYLLTEVKNASNATITTKADAAAAAATQDIYVIGTVITDAASQTVTKYEKGTAESAMSVTPAKVYAIGSAPVADVSAVTDTDELMYIDSVGTAATAGDAAFRYVGALSEAKSGWAAGAGKDLIGINIAYNISAISETSYNDAAKDNGLTYGYKAESSQISIADGVLKVKGVSLNDIKSITFTVDDAEVVLSSKNGSWNAADAADAEFTFNSAWKEGLKGTTCVVTVNETITATINVPAN